MEGKVVNLEDYKLEKECEEHFGCDMETIWQLMIDKPELFVDLLCNSKKEPPCKN
jgi:hypothetical protein